MDINEISTDFQRNGFAIAEQLADTQSVESLRAAYDRILDGTTPCPTTDRKLGGLTRQIIMPHEYDDVFKHNDAVATATKITRAIQSSSDSEFVYSMLIYKPAGHRHITPWHQDVSYVASPTAPHGIRIPNHYVVTFWLALDDVDDDMGCMEFIPNTQSSPMFDHYVHSGDPARSDRLTAIREPENNLDLTRAVRCPVRAGTATIHGYHTPHYTGPNLTEKNRRAFIFSFNHPDAVMTIGRALSDFHETGN